LTEPERTRWRKQALQWLQADVAAYAKSLSSGPPTKPATVKQRLQNWRQDKDLAGVRDPAVMNRLAPTERDAFTKLWAEVDDVLRELVKPEQ
jgi:hypothetical protein